MSGPIQNKNTDRKWDLHREMYNSHDVVSQYSSHEYLTPAENAILALLRCDLADMYMLDVGVGGGRTVEHFAPLVRSYIGVDIAEEMIKACRTKFPQYNFAVADAADLSHYGDESFDFILFSYNGIDHLDLDRRHRSLREFRRLLRPRGHLAYSSHNINFLPMRLRELRPRFSFHPFRFAGQLKRYLRFTSMNQFKTWSSTLPRQVVYEIFSNRCGVPCMYVRPDAETDALGELGFGNIKIISDVSGEEVKGERELAAIIEPWVYYLCRKA